MAVATAPVDVEQDSDDSEDSSQVLEGLGFAGMSRAPLVLTEAQKQQAIVLRDRNSARMKLREQIQRRTLEPVHPPPRPMMPVPMLDAVLVAGPSPADCLVALRRELKKVSEAGVAMHGNSIK